MVKLGEMMMILDLHRQGLSVSAIAKATGADRKTVRKYIELGLEAPSYGPRKPRQAVIDPFTAYLRERVIRYPCHSACNLTPQTGSSASKIDPHPMDLKNPRFPLEDGRAGDEGRGYSCAHPA